MFSGNIILYYIVNQCRRFKELRLLECMQFIELHIGELLDDTHGMSNSEILNYQLDKFREVLEQYKNKREQRIVFIHGKGDGVLRKALLDELKRKYPTFRHQDASFQEYGFGATMITIK